jgi:DNA helicase IV
VATVQAKQDEIIRLDHSEVLAIETAQAPGRPW